MTQASIKQWGHDITRKEAYLIIRAELKAVIYRFEPFSRLLCPMVRAAITQRFPGIKPYYPESRDKLWSMILEIDSDILAQCAGYLRSTLGLATVACDGVTILGMSYLLYTIAKGEYVTFVAL